MLGVPRGLGHMGARKPGEADCCSEELAALLPLRRAWVHGASLNSQLRSGAWQLKHSLTALVPRLLLSKKPDQSNSVAVGGSAEHAAIRMTDWLMAGNIDIGSTTTRLTALLEPGKCHCSSSSRPTLPSSTPPTPPVRCCA